MIYPKGHEFSYEKIYPSLIKVDETYQRRLDNPRVDKIVRDWNGDVFNEPKVSQRKDGSYYVFNGQHSTAAWKKKMGANTPILCKVYQDMTWSDECIAFILQNGLDKDPTTNEKLRAAYENKDPDVVDMVSKASLCGFVVDFSVNKTPTRIVATAALLRAYKTLGADTFLDMLTVIRDAWYGDMDAVSTQIISGMATFFKTYYGFFDSKNLAHSLKRIEPAKIIREGKRASFEKNGYARAICDQYNFKRKPKSRLEVAKLT